MVNTTQPINVSIKMAFICLRLSPPGGKVVCTVGDSIMPE